MSDGAYFSSTPWHPVDCRCDECLPEKIAAVDAPPCDDCGHPLLTGYWCGCSCCYPIDPAQAMAQLKGTEDESAPVKAGETQ